MPPASAILPPPQSDRSFFLFNAVVSTGAVAFLAWLLLAPRGATGSVDLGFMPAVNAGFNGLSTLCLLCGYVAIRRKRPDLHRYFMVGALTASALFLVGYVAYHYVHGDTKFTGVGAIRPVYFALLISHIVLSVFVLPLALTAVYFAVKKRFVTHRKVTRIALPLWLYVSATGVLLFFMLHVWFAPR
ncbi:MAG: DUF420 domain-containing protein [Myxococcota bacterium]|nr:DUF420 domain-containing protein [Myxococcota bacterium]